MKTLKDINKLPQWAQKMITGREQALFDLEQKVDALEQANMICNEMDWFTLGVHTPERRPLFIIDQDKPQQICSIGDGAVLLVGHKRRGKS